MTKLDDHWTRHPMASARTDNEVTGGDLVVGAISLVIVLLTVGGVQAIAWAWTQLPRLVPSGPKDLGILLGIALAAVILGRFLFAFKVHNQWLYGTVEIGVGAGAAILAWTQNIDKAKDDPWSGLFAILGAVYIVVRGFDNIRKYKEDLARQIKESAAQIASSAVQSDHLPP